ncbi:MAG: riboflavin biosynthesis protein RibF [Planctomycetota bacterium]|nr:MAG: riboflavin biosynthesis protein RibF [Planctomycetota bacterium]
MTVGNFDGVHLGHAGIVRELLAAGRARGLPAVVFTFDPHPARILRPDCAPPLLSTPDRRAELLGELGVDAVLVQPVDAALLALDAETFYHQILRGTGRAVLLAEGPDFRFGAGRRGDMDLLRRLAAHDAVEAITVAAVAADGQPISSSRIRTLIAAGRVEEAAGLLTAPYRIRGQVVRGKARGRTLGFPTANLAGVTTLLPGPGVYGGRARQVSPAGANGQPPQHWPAAIHIGPNVSFDEQAVSVEVHLIGFEGDLYDQQLDVDFLARVRDTRRFDSPDALRHQLSADISQAALIARSSDSLGPR